MAFLQSYIPSFKQIPDGHLNAGAIFFYCCHEMVLQLSNLHSGNLFIWKDGLYIDTGLRLLHLFQDQKKTELPETKQGKSEGFDSCDRPSNLKLDSNRQFFRPSDREIWRMTLQYNRAPLLCYFKLCASFRSHWWIQTSITVRKRPIWVKCDDF